MIYTDDGYMFETLKKRDKDAHKGDFGKILIYAGSTGMAGAAVLCGRAALKAGSGLVRFLLLEMPCAIYPVLQTAVPEATCVAFQDTMDLNEYDAIACGSGIGQGEAAFDILKYILKHYGNADLNAKKQAHKALVLDADALNLVSRSEELAELVRTSPAAVIITPHVGEAKRLLTSCAGIAGLTGRKNAACDLAEKFNCIAVLKGAGTLVAEKSSGKEAGSPAGQTSVFNSANLRQPLYHLYQNTTGNPGMATGGSGDSLSGIIASLAGQGYAPLDAARMGVFIHGKAGDIAAEKLGEMSVTAGDITDNIPYALKELYKSVTHRLAGISKKQIITCSGTILLILRCL